MRKVFTDNLPTWGTGTNKSKIKWSECEGYKVKFVYDNIEGYITIMNFNKNTNKVKILYNDEEFYMKAKHFKDCHLGKVLKIMTSDFRYEIGQRIKDDKRDITITDRKYIKNKYGQNCKYYKYKCNKCGFDCGYNWNNLRNKYQNEHLMIEGHIKRGSGCACCNGTVVVKEINSIWKTNPELIKYFVNKEESYNITKGVNDSNKKVLVRCLNCGEEKYVIPSCLNDKIPFCNKCSDNISYPNKFMYNILSQLKQQNKINDFKCEYSPNWIKPKRYDFCIPSMKLIIEMDGGFHTQNNNMSGQTAKESKEIDKYKDKLAYENGFKVIRIDCDYGGKDLPFNYIKNSTLNSDLKNILDFSYIDWDKVCNNMFSNLVKIACDMKCKNMLISDIAKELKFSITTIRRWIKQGVELQWCEYTIEDERHKASIKNGMKRMTPIELYKDGILLGVFKGQKELERKSEELFGIFLDSKCMSNVAKGKRKSYKGFVIKYHNLKGGDINE